MCAYYTRLRNCTFRREFARFFLGKDILQHLHFEFEFAKKTLLNNCRFTMYAGFPTKKGRDDAERTFLNIQTMQGFLGNMGKIKVFF